MWYRQTPSPHRRREMFGRARAQPDHRPLRQQLLGHRVRSFHRYWSWCVVVSPTDGYVDRGDSARAAQGTRDIEPTGAVSPAGD